jgi:hypothetical protein
MASMALCPTESLDKFERFCVIWTVTNLRSRLFVESELLLLLWWVFYTGGEI